MKIPEYKSLKDKEEAFGGNYKRIKSITDLDSFLTESESIKNYIFRGVCEAKYQNFTSAQRMYIVNELFLTKIEDLIQKQIDYIKEAHRNLLKRYYKSLGIIPNDMLYLGIAQHYGGISPLLDFTTDLKTALYFLADGAEFPSQGTNGIGNYSSLYFFVDENLKDYKTRINGIAEAASTIYNNLDDSGLIIDERIGNNFIEAIMDFSFEDLLSKKRGDIKYLLPNYEEALKIDIKAKNNLYRNIFTISNLNIVAQKGCFVFYLPEQSTAPFEKPLHCVDIHKSLIPYICDYTKLRESDVYPDEYELVKDSLSKVLKQRRMIGDVLLPSLMMLNGKKKEKK